MNNTKTAQFRKFGILVALILLASLLFNAILGLAAKSIVEHSGFRLSQAAHNGTRVHILIAGNSRGVNLMDASQATPKSFNLSFNGLNTGAILALTKDFFQSGNSADVVVLEVSGLLVPGSSCELKTYWSVLSNLAKQGQVDCAFDWRIANLFPLTAFDSELFLRALYYWPGNRNDQNWANDYLMTAQACRHPPSAGLKAFSNPISPQDAADLRNQLQALKFWLTARDPKIKIALVLAPFFPSPAVAEDIGRIRNNADRVYGKGNYLDLTQSPPNECRQFSDELHVNRDGRAALRGRILDYVRNL